MTAARCCKLESHCKVESSCHGCCWNPLLFCLLIYLCVSVFASYLKSSWLHHTGKQSDRLIHYMLAFTNACLCFQNGPAMNYPYLSTAISFVGQPHLSPIVLHRIYLKIDRTKHTLTFQFQIILAVLPGFLQDLVPVAAIQTPAQCFRDMHYATQDIWRIGCIV